MAKVLTFTACAAAVGVALYAAAGYVGVPYAVRTVIEKNVSELLNRTVTLDDVRFNPGPGYLNSEGSPFLKKARIRCCRSGCCALTHPHRRFSSSPPYSTKSRLTASRSMPSSMKKIAENLRNSSAEMTPTRQLKQLRNPQIHLTPVFLSSRSTTSPLRTVHCATKTNHRALMSHSLTYR